VHVGDLSGLGAGVIGCGKCFRWSCLLSYSVEKWGSEYVPRSPRLSQIEPQIDWAGLSEVVLESAESSVWRVCVCVHVCRGRVDRATGSQRLSSHTGECWSVAQQ
jgi:hypothetical protein